MKHIYRSLLCCLVAALCSISAFAQWGRITTIAGDNTDGSTGDGGPATVAKLGYVRGLCLDNAGNIFIADKLSGRIRKVNPSGIITHFAGGGTSRGDGGPASVAQFNGLSGITIDGAGNMYVVEMDGQCVRKINTAGIISTFAGGGPNNYYIDNIQATAAQLFYPADLKVNNTTGDVYISDYEADRIRVVRPSGIINAFAGVREMFVDHGDTAYLGDGGPATIAHMLAPQSLSIDKDGNVYTFESGNAIVRKINTSGIISTTCGTGIAGYNGDNRTAVTAQLDSREHLYGGVHAGRFGDIFIADPFNRRVRKIDARGVITTIAGDGMSAYTGDGGPASAARMLFPLYVTGDKYDNLYIVDWGRAVRKIERIPDIVNDSFKAYIKKSCSGLNLTFIASTYTAGMYVKTYFGDGVSDSSIVLPTGEVSIGHNYAASGMYTLRIELYRAGALVGVSTADYEHVFCNNFRIGFYFDENNNCIKDVSEDDIYKPTTVVVDSNGVSVDTVSAINGLYYTALAPVGTVYGFRVLNPAPGFRTTCPTSGVIYDTVTAMPTDGLIKYFAMQCSGATEAVTVSSSVRYRPRFAEGRIAVSPYVCSGYGLTLTMDFSPRYSFRSANVAPTTIAGNSVSWALPAMSGGTYPQYISFTLTANPLSDIRPGDTVHTRIRLTSIHGEMDSTDYELFRVDTVRASFDPNEIAVSPKGLVLPCTEMEYTIHFENMGNDTAHNIHVMDTLPDCLDINSLRMLYASADMNIAYSKHEGHNVVKFDFPNIMLPDSSHHNMCNGMFVYKIMMKRDLADGVEATHRVGIYFDDNDVVLTNIVNNTIGFGAIEGQDTICGGIPILLTSKTEGGEWTSLHGLCSINGGLVTATGIGLDTVKYTASNSCVTRTSLKPINIGGVMQALTVTKTPITNDTICGAAPTVTYSATLVNGGATPDIKWTVNGIVRDSDEVFVYVPRDGDIVKISMVSSLACPLPIIVTHSDTMVVSDNFTPVVNINTGLAPGAAYCEGTPTTFKAMSVGGGNRPVYTWKLNGTEVSASTSYRYIPQDGDRMTLTMISNHPCRVTSVANSATYIMNVAKKYLPWLDITMSQPVVELGKPVTFTAHVTNGGPSPTYKWLINNHIINGATSETYVSEAIADRDSITCVVNETGVCSYSTFNSVVVKAGNLGVAYSLGASSVALIPNPNNGEFTLSGSSLMLGDELNIEVKNMIGQIVYASRTTLHSTNFNEVIKLSNTTVKGIYFLMVRGKGWVSSVKFVVE